MSPNGPTQFQLIYECNTTIGANISIFVCGTSILTIPSSGSFCSPINFNFAPSLSGPDLFCGCSLTDTFTVNITDAAAGACGPGPFMSPMRKLVDGEENEVMGEAPQQFVKKCLYLGSPVSAFRFNCKKGHANPDGLGGVKLCCDCGPNNCDDYVAEED